MAYISLTHPTVPRLIETFWNALIPWRNRAAQTEEPPEESGDRRDFIMEMMDRHPDAFQSEMDIQNMVRLYHSRF